jgi:endonuclease-3 related protein
MTLVLSIRQRLEEIYRLLFSYYGPQHWWPADAPFGVIVGAILTQATAWANVEKAISNLKSAGMLNPTALRQVPLDELAELIRPCGYYKVKSRKLKSFAQHLASYDDSLKKLFALELEQLRLELLSIYGIGEETADAIILYAAGKPIFVIDAYTRRILSRLGLAPLKGSYTAFQKLFMENLPRDEKFYNEYHALFVRHGKETCRKNPLCLRCPLRALCSYS